MTFSREKNVILQYAFFEVIVRSAIKGSMRIVKQGCITTDSATTQPMKGYVYIARPDRVGW